MNADVNLQIDAILLHLDEADLVRSFTQAELILAEHNIDIEVDSLEEYADVLIEMSESDEGFSLDEKDFFGKVGKLVRTVAHQIGKAQGKVKGAKDRWSAFKNSVAAANQGGYDRGHASTATDQTVKNTPKGTRPKGWKQQAQQQSFKAKNRGAKVGDRSTRKDGTVWQKDKDGSWTQVVGSGKKKQPKLRLVKPLAASAEPGDLDARLDEILARMGRG
jgi:hypothetical protein